MTLDGIILNDIQLTIYIEEEHMAPRNKFTREEMIMGALNVVRKRGSASLTARAVAEELGVSTQPIFTCFGTMDELKSEVRDAAEGIYKSYVAEGLKNRVPFFGFGMQYMRFAKEESELYRLLFLTGNGGAIEAMESSKELILDSLMEFYKMNHDEAERFYRDMWLIVNSLAALVVTGSCPYDDEMIGKILTGFSIGIVKAIKEVPGFVDGSFDRDAVFRSVIK